MHWVRRVASWVASAVVGDALVGWLLPVAVAGVGVLVAWLSGTPLFYLYVGTFIVAAMSSNLLLNVRRWHTESRVEDKLAFHSGRLIRNVDEYGVFKGMTLGVQFRNLAAFPLTFDVKSMDTMIIDRANGKQLYPPAKKFDKTKFSVEAGNVVFFDGYTIDVSGTATGDFVAEIRCDIAYGKGSATKYSLIANKRADFFVKDGLIVGNIIWYDLQE